MSFVYLTMQRFFVVLMAVVFAFTGGNGAFAASLIRDAEIEHTIRDIANPIFHAAGLTPSSVNLFIVQDDSINAYVAGGANIFIHTGLLLEADTPEMLAGVIAHETGHITGSHLAMGGEKLRQAQIGTVLSYVLGALAIAGGGGQAGAAVMQAGQHTVERGFLAFTRANEQFADQAALNYLEKTQLSPDGMLQMFERLRRNEHLQLGEVDPYSLTHPLSKERIAHIRHSAEQSPHKDKMLSAQQHEAYDVMRAKLFGFLQEPRQTFLRYGKQDTSFAAHYARAVAWYKYPDLKKALVEIAALEKLAPTSPFVHEFKGQVLFEHHKIDASVEAYAKAVALSKDIPLIQLGYGQSLLAQYTQRIQKGGSAKHKNPVTFIRETANLLQKATRYLELSSRGDATNPHCWQLLAEAYGKAGLKGKMHLAMAEKYALEGELEEAREYSKLATKELKAGTPAFIRASDLNLLMIREIADKEEK